MPFNSIYFIIFLFGIWATLLYLNKEVKIIALLLFSYIFHGYAGWTSILLLLFVTSITSLSIFGIRRFPNRHVHLWGISCILLTVLLVKMTPSIISLPFFNPTTISSIGFMFYSLQAIGLIVDINNKKFKTPLRLKEVALFLAFFPQSLAGPIHRGHDLVPQFQKRLILTPNRFMIGVYHMLWGFVCKLLIADKIAFVIDPIFNQFNQHNGLLLYTAVILYTFQIYYDFWGYSLIAIGIGKIIGFDININFRNPYTAKSFQEFWHRWHISLSTWFRDYVYKPLGGSKKGYWHYSIAIYSSFILSGLWHGSSIIFLLWGFIHATLLILEKYIFYHNSFLILQIRNAFFLLLIPFTWLIFRSKSIQEIHDILSSVASISNWSLHVTQHYFNTPVLLAYLVGIFLLIIISHLLSIENQINRIPIATKEKFIYSFFSIICMVLLLLFGDLGPQEFIYFQF